MVPRRQRCVGGGHPAAQVDVPAAVVEGVAVGCLEPGGHPLRPDVVDNRVEPGEVVDARRALALGAQRAEVRPL